MGIYDRSYYRERPGGGGGDDRNAWFGDTGAWPPVVKWLIIINVVVFLLQIFVTVPVNLGDELARGTDFANSLPRDSVIEKWFALDAEKVTQGQIWRVFTCSFLHSRATIWHILMNMLLLVWFGRTLESMYGSREFALFYGAAAITAGLAFLALQLITNRQGIMIGASGGIMGVFMLFALHFPRAIIRLFFVIPIEIRWVALFYIIFDLHPVLLALSGSNVATGVAHAAHLGGGAFAFLYYKRKLHLDDMFSGIKTKTKAKKDQVIQQVEERHEEKVDAILDKISEHGIGSLSEAEKRMLKQSSEKYKKKR